MAKATQETLEDFITRHEEASQAAGLVVTAIKFPEAKARVFPGRYAGIPLADAKTAEATYSDGTTHA